MLYIRKIFRKNKGQSLVELALVLPILLLLLMGIMDFGRIFSAYLSIHHASRDGARYASVGHTDTDIYQQVIKELPTLDSSKVIVGITPYEGNRGRGNDITVKVNYDINIMTPIISGIVPNPFNMEASTTMRIE